MVRTTDVDQMNVLYPNEREKIADLRSSYSVFPSGGSCIIGGNLRVCKPMIYEGNRTQLTAGFGYPRSGRSQGGKRKFDVEVDYFLGNRNYEDDLRRLVDTRRATRGVEAGGRIGDGGGDVDGGEGGYDSQITNLDEADLRVLGAPLCWCGRWTIEHGNKVTVRKNKPSRVPLRWIRNIPVVKNARGQFFSFKKREHRRTGTTTDCGLVE